MSSTTNRYRHIDDDRWYTLTPVTEQTAIDTPWGKAVAEVGTLVATDVDDETHKIIVHPDDLKVAWTQDDVPPPVVSEAFEGPVPEVPAPVVDELKPPTE